MSKEKLSFVQPDILVLYFNGEFSRSYHHPSNSEYNIIVIRKGKVQIEYSDKIFYLKSGDTFIENKNEDFVFTTSSKTIEYFEVRLADHTMQMDFEQSFFMKSILKLI